jgi:hypothetical protein
MNGWGVRAGWAGGPTPTADLDGMAGSGDEVNVGLLQTTLRHAPGLDQCTTFYEYVRPGQAAATFHNYDLDMPLLAARVRYYPPSASYDPLGNTGGLAGVASGSSAWNNAAAGTPNVRVGDSIVNPEPGWWRIVTCSSDLFTSNQFIQEGQIDRASYTAQPGTPELALQLTPSAAQVAAGDSLSLTLDYTNRSSGATAGAALATTFSIALPTNLTFVGCAGASCSQTGTTLTVTIGSVSAGASGSVTITTLVKAGATGTLGFSAAAAYNDLLGNPYRGGAGATVGIQ